MKQKILLLILVCWTGAVFASDLYKWTDANGVVHFSDTPPPGPTGKSTKVRVDKGVTAGVDDSADAAKPPAAPATPATPAPAPPPPVIDSPENRARICDQARANIELLQSKFQVADSTGKPLDPTARQTLVDQAKASAAASCADGK
jgi:Domain of unknown function (DUF4124)